MYRAPLMCIYLQVATSVHFVRHLRCLQGTPNSCAILADTATPLELFPCFDSLVWSGLSDSFHLAFSVFVLDLALVLHHAEQTLETFFVIFMKYNTEQLSLLFLEQREPSSV